MEKKLVVMARKNGYMLDEFDETKQGKIFCHKDKLYFAIILTDDRDPDFHYVHDEIDESHGMDKDYFDEHFEIRYEIRNEDASNPKDSEIVLYLNGE